MLVDKKENKGVWQMKKVTAVVTMVLILLLAAGLSAYAVVAPRVSIGYSNQAANTVDVTLTWDDSGIGHYDAFWADNIINDGSGLSYQDISGSIITSGSRKSVTKTGLTKYKNYFFKIVNDDTIVQEAAYVRVFPVNTAGYNAARSFNDHAHGNFTDNTPMCGGCHSTHSALKAQLLKEATYYQLCKLCHGTAATQSKYDVETGKVTVSDGAGGTTTVNSLGGPFVTGTTSKHDADDSYGGWGPVVVPGSDPAKSLSLTCISCHNGHGGKDDNYRLLKKDIYVDDAKTESLKTVNIDFDAFAVTPAATSGENLYLVKGNTEFCAACHLDFENGSGQTADKDSRLTTSARYRHSTTVSGVVYSVYGSDGSKDYSPSYWGPLPLQYNAAEAKAGVTDKRTAVVCSTCHFAHGTTKQFNTVTGNSKYILRLENYGTCESCHRK